MGVEIDGRIVILSEIEGALERRAERAARHIAVELENGTVTLTGPVRSSREREVVLGTGRHTPGVKAVVDRLHLSPRS
ncbi:MAG: BON domain-containing protein [Chloroflexi bacterium]|nr:BON domain-containing protein [Chloroflexota bacterium]